MTKLRGSIVRVLLSPALCSVGLWDGRSKSLPLIVLQGVPGLVTGLVFQELVERVRQQVQTEDPRWPIGRAF